MVATPNDVIPLGKRARRWIPSLIGYDSDGGVVIGDDADRPDVKAIRSIKRAITMGQQSVRANLPEGPSVAAADDLMVAFLTEALRVATDGGARIDRHSLLRLGCPAGWNGKQRRRLLAIATRAGLPATLPGLVDEPVAAGIAWLSGLRADRPGPLRMLVFDMGGGTLDIAVLDVQGDRRRDVAVLAANGIPEAGDALDEAIADDLEEVIGRDLDASPNPASARAELRDVARRIKVGLTTDDETPVALSRRYFDNAEIWYTRNQFNAVFEPQMDRAEDAVIATLRAARITERSPDSSYDISRTPVADLVGAVDVVVLSGGMSHVPYVRDRLMNLFNSGRTEIVNAYPPSYDATLFQAPELAVAVGLARADDFGRINMYRPSFDIYLEWNNRQECKTIYDAFTPLVETWQIARGGTNLCYVRNGVELGLPRTGNGVLRVESHNGTKVRATMANDDLDGFSVALSEQKFEFSIYPNGRIRMRDGKDITYEGRLDDWHTIERG
jgi:molecular chaperone DnaK (HSP70)